MTSNEVEAALERAELGHIPRAGDTQLLAAEVRRLNAPTANDSDEYIKDCAKYRVDQDTPAPCPACKTSACLLSSGEHDPAAFRVNMLRLCPQLSHEEIDLLIAQARAAHVPHSHFADQTKTNHTPGPWYIGPRDKEFCLAVYSAADGLTFCGRDPRAFKVKEMCRYNGPLVDCKSCRAALARTKTQGEQQ